MRLENCSDVDVVRWAYVRALKLWGRQTGDEADDNALADQIIAMLLAMETAAGVARFLEIDDLEFAERVRQCLRDNEALRVRH